jgi:hypothetical protein
MKILTKREFHGEEFYAWCQQQYDIARNHLKNCGKPKTELDLFWIQHYKWDAQFFKKFLD